MAEFTPIDPNQIVQPMGQMMIMGALKTMIAGMTAVFMGKTDDTPSYKKPSSIRSINVAKLHVNYAQVMQEGRNVIDRIVKYGGDLSMETQMTKSQFALLQRIAAKSDGRIAPPEFVETIGSMQDLYVLQSLGYVYVSWRQA